MEKDADGTDDLLTTLSAVVSGGRIKCRWQVKYTTDEDDANSQKELADHEARLLKVQLDDIKEKVAEFAEKYKFDLIAQVVVSDFDIFSLITFLIYVNYI